MAWVATAVIVGSSALMSAGTAYIQRKDAKKAAKRAEKQAQEDAKQARKAEVFAETEGQGVGQLGTVSLGVDNELQDEEDLRGPSLRI